jgi:hypothetical protein
VEPTHYLFLVERGRGIACVGVGEGEARDRTMAFFKTDDVMLRFWRDSGGHFELGLKIETTVSKV